ncbi:hypothetical protein [Candidatus Thiosymbion oneisti]|uniref:hypothetical protein n=1 Tax=Candidatus Thiosymbion oneisti TaxID=589554 RepID=UPI00105FD4C5|nr:hypothetical protein [Candidatus Thiosymbion oneisti]
MPNDRCSQISKSRPGCSCESESVSIHSPGPVDNPEKVARLIYSPLHTDEKTGKVTEAAFSDAKDKGLSVQRMAHATNTRIRTIGENKLARDHAQGKTDREFLGIVTGGVDSIRGLTHGNSERAFCVYDSALPDVPSHADVCQTTASRSEMKRARKKLRDLFSYKPFMP